MRIDASAAQEMGISRRWRAVFRVELPICAATVLYWWIAPEKFARGLLGDFAFDVQHHYFMLQGASMLGTLLVWFYGRVLFAPSIDPRTFRYLQEGLAIGDAAILALSVWLLIAGRPHVGTVIAQMCIAALWGTIRVVYLVTCRGAPQRPPRR